MRFLINVLIVFKKLNTMKTLMTYNEDNILLMAIDEFSLFCKYDLSL